MAQYDSIIVGGGIGGLVAAALLADAGLSILLLEQHTSPGGCAASFSRHDYLFESGATVGCGFHPGGPMHWLGERLSLQWPLEPLPVAWEFLDGDLQLQVDASRDHIIENFPDSDIFWSKQSETANRLWDFTSTLLAQYDRNQNRQLFNLCSHFFSQTFNPEIARLASCCAETWINRFSIKNKERFRRFIDAQLLISAQVPANRSNGLFAALALDLPRKNPCRVTGGIGTVSKILTNAVKNRGGMVHLGEKVVDLRGEGPQIRHVWTTKNEYSCRHLIFNGSDASLAELLGEPVPTDWQKNNRAAWGAFILYLGLKSNVLSGRKSPCLQLLQPGGTSLGECGSLFVSTPRQYAENGKTGLTISTHTAVSPWWQTFLRSKADYTRRKQSFTKQIIKTLNYYFPDFEESIDIQFAATPVTFARYTGRHLGLVGGYAQTGVFPPRSQRFGYKNITMVGDHSFPGQSMAGVTVGAVLASDRLLRKF